MVPAALELMDETAIACIEAAMHLGLPLDVEAILLIETDGSDEAAVLREMEAVAGNLPRTGSASGQGCRGRGRARQPVAGAAFSLAIPGAQSPQ